LLLPDSRRRKRVNREEGGSGTSRPAGAGAAGRRSGSAVGSASAGSSARGCAGGKARRLLTMIVTVATAIASSTPIRMNQKISTGSC